MLDDVGYFRETCVRRALQTEPLVPRWCYRDATSHLPWRNRDVETGETGEAGDVTISFSSLESFGLDEAYIASDNQYQNQEGPRWDLKLSPLLRCWNDMHICRWIIWIMRIVWIRWILSCLSTIIAIFWKSPRVRTIYVAVLHQVLVSPRAEFVTWCGYAGTHSKQWKHWPDYQPRPTPPSPRAVVSFSGNRAPFARREDHFPSDDMKEKAFSYKYSQQRRWLMQQHNALDGTVA